MSADDGIQIEPDQEDDAPTQDAAAPETYLRKLNDQERQKLEAEDFWTKVFAHPIGRREMWAVLQRCHFSETMFACGPNGTPQPEATWQKAGEQGVGQSLFFSWLILSREGVLIMLDEHDPRFKKPEPPRRKRKES